MLFRSKKLGKLGSGSYGTIYSAVDEEEKPIVIKKNIISKIYVNSTNSMQEFNTLQLVKNHPFCIQLKDIYFGNPFESGTMMSPLVEQDTVTDKIFLSMEQGDTDAYKWIHKSIISEHDKKLFMVQTLLSLEFLHSREIYHRDVKPNNIIIFLNEKGGLKSAKLTDFGFAIKYSHQTDSVQNVCSMWYRAPEISLHKNYDYKIDVWSLGCVFYELHTGKILAEHRDDESLLYNLVRKFKFKLDDYVLYNNLYNDILDIASYIELRKKINGVMSLYPQNTDPLLLNLMKNMLEVNVENRYTTSEALNDPYFEEYRELICIMRNKFGINRSGEWILTPVYKYEYINSEIRNKGMKLFKYIFDNRNARPINLWYTHRIIFNSMKLFDEYLIHENIKSLNDDKQIYLWINIFCYISFKYFGLMSNNLELSIFSMGLSPGDEYLLYNKGLEFEDKCLKTLFSTGVYKKTIYEHSKEYLNDKAVEIIMNAIVDNDISSGTTYDDFLYIIEKKIKVKNESKG